MNPGVRDRLPTGVLAGAAALSALAVAVVVVLNLHIYAGLDAGYMAGPAEVVEHSVLLAIVDVLLLAGAPILAFVTIVRLRTRRTGPR